jgi:hypothetical protein
MTMMTFKPTADGGRIMSGANDFGEYRIVCNRMGEITESHIVVRDPIETGYDPETQRSGCCDPPRVDQR